MRILVDIRHLSSPNLAGVGGYTKSLLNALFEIDQQNEYVLLSSGGTLLSSPTPVRDLLACGNPSSMTHRDHKNNVSFFHIPVPNKLFNLQTLLLRHPTLNWRIREPVDIIFLPNLNIATLPIDIPTVLTVHDLSFKHYPNFFSHRMQWWHAATRSEELIAACQSLIVPSQSTKRDLERFFETSREKTHVIPHGVSPTFTDKMSASDHGVRSRLKLPKKFVLCVGTIEPRKNLLTLIEGVKEYRNRTHDDLHVVMAGEWGWRSHAVRRRLWRRDTQGWIHQLGYIQSRDLPAVYRSATVTIFPSIYEGFGLPILESQASGTPVITSSTSSMPEVGGDASIYVDPYNSRDIAEALRGLLSSSSLQKQLRDLGMKRAKQFTWEKTARETLKIFQNATERR